LKKRDVLPKSIRRAPRFAQGKGRKIPKTRDLKSDSEIELRAVEPSQRRRLGGILALVFAGIFLALVAAELGLRVLGMGAQGMYQWDAYRGWSLRPGASGWQRREGNAFVRINSDGMRDREHPYAKPKGTIRIAFIGDSFTEAEQVAVEDDYVSVVERRLGACPLLRGKKVETLNFGCDSYGTAQELITLRRKVWKYSPDVVVLLFFAGNDLRNNSLSLEWHLCEPFYLLHGDQLALGGPFIDSPVFRAKCAIKFESRRSAVLNVVGDSIVKIHSMERARKALQADVGSNAMAAAKPMSPPSFAQPKAAASSGELGLTNGIYKPPENAVWDEAWKVTEKLILAIASEVKGHGAQFLAVTATVGSQVTPDPVWRAQYENSLDVKDLFYPDSRVAKLGARAGFDVLNLAPPFQSYADAHHVYLHGFANTKLGTGHWNEQGHRLAGELIAGRLCGTLGSQLSSRVPSNDRSNP